MKSPYWTLHRSGLCTVLGDTFDSPNKMWRRLRELHWTKESLDKNAATLFARVTFTTNGYHVRLFKTLAAANLFHMQEQAKAKTKSQLIRKALRKELNKQPA